MEYVLPHGTVCTCMFTGEQKRMVRIWFLKKLSLNKNYSGAIKLNAIERIIRWVPIESMNQINLERLVMN